MCVVHCAHLSCTVPAGPGVACVPPQAYAAAEKQGEAAKAAREQLGALMSTKGEAEAK